MNRCINDVFGYCHHEPHPIKRKSFTLTYDFRGRENKIPCIVFKCLKKPLTCGNHLTFSESLALPKPSVIPIP